MEEGLATLLDDLDKLMMTKAEPKNVFFVKNLSLMRQISTQLIHNNGSDLTLFCQKLLLNTRFVITDGNNFM